MFSDHRSSLDAGDDTHLPAASFDAEARFRPITATPGRQGLLPTISGHQTDVLG